MSHEHCKNTKLYPLNEGDVLDIGGRKLKVLFTPGHTAGSICLLDEENKILFAGDTIFYGPIFMFGARRNMQKYLSTLKRLRLMKNDDVFTDIYCCHNTCPVLAETVDDLIKCVEGIIDKSIVGSPAFIPNGEKPLLGKYNKCSVLFDRKD